MANLDGYAILMFAKNKYDNRYAAPEGQLDYEAGINPKNAESAAAKAWAEEMLLELLREEKVSFIFIHLSVIHLLHK